VRKATRSFNCVSSPLQAGMTPDGKPFWT
jgi:hypothetical protein